jgi:hypothetical protein
MYTSAWTCAVSVAPTTASTARRDRIFKLPAGGEYNSLIAHGRDMGAETARLGVNEALLLQFRT